MVTSRNLPSTINEVMHRFGALNSSFVKKAPEDTSACPERDACSQTTTETIDLKKVLTDQKLTVGGKTGYDCNHKTVTSKLIFTN